MSIISNILNLAAAGYSAWTAKDVSEDQKDALKKSTKTRIKAILEAGGINTAASKKATAYQVKAGKAAIDTLKHYGGRERDVLDRFGDRERDTLKRYGEKATGYLEPWRTVGQDAVYSLADLYGLPTEKNPEGGQPLSDEALAAFERSPDYQFALQQGIKAHDASAAAKGNLLSGGAERERTEFASGLASQNFGNYFSRLFQLSQLGEGAAADSGNAMLHTGDALAGSLGREGAGIAGSFGREGSAVAAGRAGIGDVRATGALRTAGAKSGTILDSASALASMITGSADLDAGGRVAASNLIGNGITSAFAGFQGDSYLKNYAPSGVVSGSTPLY